MGCGCSAVGCGCSGVGCGCSGVGCGCSGFGSSGKSHVEDAEVSDSTMAAPLVVVPEIFTSGVTSALPEIRNENFTDPLAGSSRFLKVRTDVYKRQFSAYG